MDKEAIRRISSNYLKKVKENNINFSEAWLFGSFVKGNHHDNSDIAIILDGKVSFDLEVKLMTIREGDETIIEPHIISKNNYNTPFALQIMKEGERIVLDDQLTKTL